MYVSRLTLLSIIFINLPLVFNQTANAKPLPAANKKASEVRTTETGGGTIDEATPLVTEATTSAPIDEATPFPPPQEHPMAEEAPTASADSPSEEQKPPERSIASEQGRSVDIKYRNTIYNLALAHGILYAKTNDKTYKGKLEKGLREFSHWTFAITKDKDDPYGFELIINEKTMDIIFKKDDLEAGGPFLSMVSRDSKMVMLDFGTGSGIRNLELRSPTGKLLLKDEYFDKKDPRIVDGAVFYERPEKQLEIEQDAETKVCEDVGTPWEIQPYKFNGKEKLKDESSKTRIECTN
ncbi:MAG: hypothetical protein RJB66_1891 [Pseudomonadota bacterium]